MSAELKSLKQVERDHVLFVMALHPNKVDASRILGCTIKTLYNKLHKYGAFERYRKINNDK